MSDVETIASRLEQSADLLQEDLVRGRIAIGFWQIEKAREGASLLREQAKEIEQLREEVRYWKGVWWRSK